MARKPKSRAGIDDVVLLPVSPSQQRRRRLIGGVVALVSAVLLFVLGYWLGNNDVNNAQDTNVRLEAELESLSRALSTARNELAVFKTDTDVTQQARENLRQEIKTLHQQVAELEEAVAFYKNVMAPGGQERGLQIETASLQSNEQGDTFYRVVLVQAGDNRHYLSGNITFTLQGIKDDQPVTLKGAAILAENSETRFRFRFFQELSGSIQVPEGVEITTLDVQAETSGRTRFESQKTVQWQ